MILKHHDYSQTDIRELIYFLFLSCYFRKCVIMVGARVVIFHLVYDMFTQALKIPQWGKYFVNCTVNPNLFGFERLEKKPWHMWNRTLSYYQIYNKSNKKPCFGWCYWIFPATNNNLWYFSIFVPTLVVSLLPHNKPMENDTNAIIFDSFYFASQDLCVWMPFSLKLKWNQRQKIRIAVDASIKQWDTSC